MPYKPTLDPYSTLPLDSTEGITSGTRMTAVSANASDFTAFGGMYPKALYVVVSPSTSGPHITIQPAGNDDGATVSLTLNEGTNVVDFVRIRAVTFIAVSGVLVWRIDD